MDGILAAKDTLVHTHIARPNEDRRTPKEEDIEVLKLWADTLKKIGYSARLSLECIFDKDYEADITAARKTLKIFED